MNPFEIGGFEDGTVSLKAKTQDTRSAFKMIEEPLPEIIDLVFAKTRPKRSFSMTEYERFHENAGL